MWIVDLGCGFGMWIVDLGCGFGMWIVDLGCGFGMWTVDWLSRDMEQHKNTARVNRP
jgi:hypothetical protein